VAVEDRYLLAQFTKVNARVADTSRLPVDQSVNPAANEHRVSGPHIAVDEHGPPLRRRDCLDSFIGELEQSRG
jgi:hypothetical protein